MFLGMKDFDIVQILLKFAQIYPNFIQICPNLLKKIFAKGCGRISCIPSSYGTTKAIAKNALIL